MIEYKTKIFVTKNALTKGIREVDAKIDRKYATWQQSDNFYGHEAAYANEWYLTLQEAKQKAEEMRIKKIASLTAQLKKLKAMKF